MLVWILQGQCKQQLYIIIIENTHNSLKITAVDKLRILDKVRFLSEIVTQYTSELWESQNKWTHSSFVTLLYVMEAHCYVQDEPKLPALLLLW